MKKDPPKPSDPEAKPDPKGHQGALLLALVVSGAALAIPYLQWVMLPLQYLNTHIHELCHALTAVMTGGSVTDIQVYSNGGGVTHVYGGWEFLVGSAGYIGASIVGALIVFFGRTERGARVSLVILAIALALSMVRWVRADFVGVTMGIVWIAGLLFAAKSFGARSLVFSTQLIGVQQCVASIQSVYLLFRISTMGEQQSDAQNVANITHVPAAIWAFGWCVFSLLLIGFTLAKSWRPTAAKSPAP